MSSVHGGQFPAGWYPDPDGTSMLRWFDGQQWTARYEPGAAPSRDAIWTFLPAAALVLGAIGMVLTFIPVSINSGSGMLYVGLALTFGATVLAWRMSLTKAVLISCVVFLVIAGYDTYAGQTYINQQQQKINQLVP